MGHQDGGLTFRLKGKCDKIKLKFWGRILKFWASLEWGRRNDERKAGCMDESHRGERLAPSLTHLLLCKSALSLLYVSRQTGFKQLCVIIMCSLSQSWNCGQLKPLKQIVPNQLRFLPSLICFELLNCFGRSGGNQWI